MEDDEADCHRRAFCNPGHSDSGQEGTATLDRGEIEALLEDLGGRRLALLDESGVDM